ncbi:multiple sugar transport system permease protein [Paenarthrobacter nicotinovorans]|uniref:carbohydrate ABC transporter permease n=1 Tax=Paenarthrobacter nicotinovorans TaxID=29320 RepID=UPI00277FC470|nr:sugar ABC transporter permease [Paenarthrobacter nicotinovorans]MDP9933747.1 multiple sugar transport system permease protein [Paenarthrobacter nicotinovorans]
MTTTLQRPPTETPRLNVRGRSRQRRENLIGYAFMTPWFLGFVFIIGGPVIVSLYLSFTDYAVIGKTHWVGLENYFKMFTKDPRFWASLRVTLVYLLISVPLVQVFALFLANMLNRGIRGLPIYRALFYVPSLIGGSVAIAILWRFIFEGDGLLNGLLKTLGLPADHSWIGTPSTALSTLIVLNIWQFGAAMIIYLAGLKNIPVELYEAARVDGARSWRQFRSITLPMLSPVIFFNVLMNVVAAFQAFNSAYVVSNGTGGPADSTLFYTLYLYQRGFVDFDMGYASALGWILLIISGAVAALLYTLSRRVVFYGDE